MVFCPFSTCSSAGIPPFRALAAGKKPGYTKKQLFVIGGGMVFAIIAIIILSGIGFFFIFFTNKFDSAEASGSQNQRGGGEFPVSNTPIDLSAFDKLCRKKDGSSEQVFIEPLTKEADLMIQSLFKQHKTLPPELLKKNPPVKIVYTDNKDVKSIREIIPYRIVASVDIDQETGTKEYDIYIEAYCLLRNQERSFHTNGISAAWFQGREINLGNYLASLYRK
ncbi:MAG: hypothetical protein LBH43_14375 [Treponema sp.]|jgi:hypothetical protein|nr:hypothetical protein [Treponema sp.]